GRCQNQHSTVVYPPCERLHERSRIGDMLDHFRCVDDVEATARQRRTVLQNIGVDRHAELCGADAAILGELDTAAFAAVVAAPEIERKAEAAADVQQGPRSARA